jgi:hypothetical protein
MWLLVVAAFGMLVPNGIFVWWLTRHAFDLLAPLSDPLALAFVLDVFAATFLLCWLFARKPLGPYRWGWFLALSLLGTLCFGIPMYLWLNWRSHPAPRPPVSEWWRAA